MESKKKFNWFKLILGVLFIAYASLYTLDITGYYDGSRRRKIEFTEEQIAEFEEDIQNGVEVDLKDYLDGTNKDYTNGASKIGYTISKNIDAFLNKGIKDILNFLGKILS